MPLSCTKVATVSLIYSGSAVNVSAFVPELAFDIPLPTRTLSLTAALSRLRVTLSDPVLDLESPLLTNILLLLNDPPAPADTVVQLNEPSPSDVRDCPAVPLPLTFNCPAPIEFAKTDAVNRPLLIPKSIVVLSTKSTSRVTPSLPVLLFESPLPAVISPLSNVEPPPPDPQASITRVPLQTIILHDPLGTETVLVSV